MTYAEIARVLDISPKTVDNHMPEQVAIKAGRLMLARIEELADRRADFAFEMTLSGLSARGHIADLTAAGYEVHIVYLWLPSAAESI